MPTYVYECSSCKSQFEADQRITENPLTSCPCGSEGTVKRIIQPIAVMFKGGGFHINDYAKSSGAPATSEGASTSSPEAPAAPAPAPPTSTESTAS